MKNVNVMMVGALAVALSSCGKKNDAAQQAQGPTHIRWLMFQLKW